MIKIKTFPIRSDIFLFNFLENKFSIYKIIIIEFFLFFLIYNLLRKNISKTFLLHNYIIYIQMSQNRKKVIKNFYFTQLHYLHTNVSNRKKVCNFFYLCLWGTVIYLSLLISYFF
jgi:hypothetical protein